MMEEKSAPSIVERVVRGLLNACCFVVFAAGLYYTHAVIYPEQNLPWYRAAFYLTQWQTRMHGVWCLISIAKMLGARFPSNKTTARIYSVMFDITAIVSAVFWGMWSKDPRLILPYLKDPVNPWNEYKLWICHAHHTMPFVAMSVEGMLFPRSLSVDVWPTLVEPFVVLGIALFYLSWVFFGVYVLRIWDLPYGFLRVNSNSALVLRVCGLSLSIVVLVFILHGLRKLVSRIHANVDVDHPKKD